jgi:hypothetical protein
MYENKINGHVAAGEHLTGNLQFYSVSTAVDISGAAALSQAALDKLVEVISLNGQPVIMGAPVKSGSTYTLKFAVEHTGAWVDSAALVAAIKAHAPMFAADATLAAVIGETL